MDEEEEAGPRHEGEPGGGAGLVRTLGVRGEAVEDGGQPDMVRGKSREKGDGEDGGLDRDEADPEHELEDAACVAGEAVSVGGGEEE